MFAATPCSVTLATGLQSVHVVPPSVERKELWAPPLFE